MTLTVSDSAGGIGRGVVRVAVDRDSKEALVRAGFARGETPALRFHGKAVRAASGGLHLSEGAPWGWVKGGEQPMEELRGLRSFTLSGWLKPESLLTGSGGNRILFCLNKDHSGIDLASHADGRLRLAVNQWPDSVQNDSSPGKLQPGKWTFFAVTYDAAQPADNVAWYFSKPLDQPGPAGLALDRRTTHQAGPVGTDIGPLAIGNFNETMHGYGLDRQFRGEIRALQLFGSRIGGRGALDLEAIQQHLH